MNVLAIDQYGQKALINDSRIKTLLSHYGYNSARPIFRDTKDHKSQKVGYLLTLRGYNPLWIELFNIENVFKSSKGAV